MAMAAGLALTESMVAQQPLDARSQILVNLPDRSPIAVVAGDWGPSQATPSGGAMLLDFKTSLILRNVSGKVIRGVTLEVVAHDVTPGGKASVSVPSLNVLPGQNFPVQIDLRLMRPAMKADEPIVELNLDGVLFSDLSFIGNNRLDSRRSMMVWEMEARRDRQYFKSVLEGNGQEALKQEMVASLSRQVDRARMDAQVSRTNRVTAGQPEREIRMAFLNFPDSPVEPVEGIARVARNEARTPQISLRNRTGRPVKFLELGWIVRDRQGGEYFAGAMPTNINLGPHQQGTLGQSPSLVFKQRSGAAIEIESLTSFVSNVEYADGSVWVPGRREMSDGQVRRALMPSPEEQRLSDLYRKKGLNALVEELKKF